MKPLLFSRRRILPFLALAFSGQFSLAEKAEEKQIAVGEKAPAFTLKDQSGTERSLKDYLAKGPVVLAFYRSADW